MARGSITPRPTNDGKVRYRIKWESRGPDGKRKHHSATRATKKEADQFLIEKLKEVGDGTFVQPSRETVAPFLERWLNASRSRVSEATIYQYASVIRCRINPHLGHIPLARLDGLTIQELYAELETKDYAPRSILEVHAILNTALDQAVAWRMIGRNPTDGVIAPSSRSRVPEAWDAVEAARFLASAEEHEDRHRTLWRLGLDTGMRMGEMLALSWRDVSSDRAVVTVRRSLTRTLGGRHRIGEHAKNSSSHRSIVLGATANAALRAHRARQNERRLAAGIAWQDLELVFDRGDGRFYDPTTIRWGFERAVIRAGVPRLTPHGMRHTMATLMLAAGVHPKIVSERLGHSSIKMTMDRYSHVSMTMQHDAAAVIDALLSARVENVDSELTRPGRGHGA
jgi:integrase